MEKRSQVACIGLPHPQSWQDYREGCVGTFRGGHRGAEAEAFAHGMETVFNLLEAEFPPAEQCKAATELLAACVAANNFGSRGETEGGISVSYLLQTAIARAAGR